MTMNWMLADMNAYFASVEQYLRPELRGRAVGVIPVESEGTCVIAANYAAKRHGIKVGTRVRDARHLCPGIALVKARPKIYVQVHHEILRSVDQCAPVHKVYSIDEWTIQLLGNDRQPGQAAALAGRIKQQMLQDFGPWLTCSIGIGPTRLLAKIGSDLQKPDGLTLLPVSDLPDRLEHFTLKDLCGISHGIFARLNRHGIRNIRDLWQVTRRQAIHIWGSTSGAQWWAGFHGHDEPEVPTHRRSMSHANVLEPRLRNEEGAHDILVRLICRLGSRLRHDQYYAQNLGISLKGVRGGIFSESIPLPCAQDTPTLLVQFYKLWHRRPPDFPPPLKVGACVSDLVPVAQVPRSLFDEVEKPLRASQAVDQINRRLGPAAVYFGAMHNCRQQMDDKIAFGRIPDEY